MEKDISQFSESELDSKPRWNLREISKLDPHRDFKSEISQILELDIDEKRNKLEQLRQELKEINDNILIPIAPDESLSIHDLNDKLRWNISEYGRLNSDYDSTEELQAMSNLNIYQKASKLAELRRLRKSQYAPPPRRQSRLNLTKLPTLYFHSI